jgi:hypothetical protein
MTKLLTILVASFATATVLLVIATADAHAAHHSHVAVSSGSTSVNHRPPWWPPCRNWHKICHPY